MSENELKRLLSKLEHIKQIASELRDDDIKLLDDQLWELEREATLLREYIERKYEEEEEVLFNSSWAIKSD